MAHPHHEHRQSKVEHRRVAEMIKGYASGGGVHSDEKADIKLIKSKVKKTALKMSGEHPKHRADKRARGGRTKMKKGTTVNIINSPGHALGGAPMVPPGGAAPAMPPHPPMAPPAMPPGPPMGGAPGGMPPMPPGGPMPPRPGMPPPGMPMRAKGGRVKDGPAWEEGLKSGTQVQHSDGKSDGKNIGRGKVVTFRTGGSVGQTPGTAGPGVPYKPTYARTKEPIAADEVKRATGGKVESPKGVAKATMLPGGSGGGEARLTKEKRARRDYAVA